MAGNRPIKYIWTTIFIIRNNHANEMYKTIIALGSLILVQNKKIFKQGQDQFIYTKKNYIQYLQSQWVFTGYWFPREFDRPLWPLHARMISAFVL